MTHSYNPYVVFPQSQGYKQQRAYIIAQSPMVSTARDFWKMIYDKRCGVVVMLSELTEEGKVGNDGYSVLIEGKWKEKCGMISVCDVLYFVWPNKRKEGRDF